MKNVTALPPSSLDNAAAVLIVAGAIGFFGGLLAEQPLIMLAGVVAFIAGLVVRAVNTRRAIRSLPKAESLEARREVNARVQWMYVAVLVGFVSFLVRFLLADR
ncbi:MAG: hypothetical protein WCC60_22845 [Ilumatobacteraceae bacterium]